MATLTGQTVAATYNQLLKLESTAITSSPQVVQDGVGGATKLSLSNTGVTSTGTLTVDGVSTLTGAVTATGGVTGDLTGNVTATSVLVDGVRGTTQSASDNSRKVATTAYVDLMVGSPATLAGVLANGNTTGSTNIIVSASQSITTDTISETTDEAGVTIDSVLVKDNTVTATTFTGDVAGDVIGDVTGDIKADDAAAIITSGADLANSSIGNGVTATTQSSGDNSTKVATTAYADAAGTVSIQAVRCAITGSDTYYGAGSTSDGEQSLNTTSVTLAASTTYLLEWVINIAESHGGSSSAMDADVEFSTDDVTYTPMYDVKQYHTIGGGSGHSHAFSLCVGFIHGFTTNSTGGTYYFQFDTNASSGWIAHDINLKIMNVSDFGGGQTYTQSE